MTVDAQLIQIQRKLNERTMGSPLPPDRVNSPTWIESPTRPLDRPDREDLLSCDLAPQLAL
jgi:hypothetical protein